MKTKAKSRRTRPPRSLSAAIRKFLTPALWKQAHQQRRAGKRSSRWRTQPLVLMLLFMTWSCGDSQPERFETAKAFCVVCLPRRRRPGHTVPGFQKALNKMPMAVLRTLAAGVRRVLAQRLARRGYDDGFIVIGCDGSRVECPRSQELEERLGQAGKDGSAPSIWVTALVLLRLSVPWTWRLGKGTASERAHMQQMIPCLPRAALLVADAGYVGFELAKHLVAARVQFLFRMCSSVTLYTYAHVPLQRFREGIVYYWPDAVQKRKEAPLKLRLLRIRAKKTKHDVWLLTNVMDPARLPAKTAAKFYRWRWQNEGVFRTYKQTLMKVKLFSRTVRMVHREAEGSLLALQLMLAQGALAMPLARQGEVEKVCSPRQVLLAIRQEMSGRSLRGCGKYLDRLRHACCERRQRSSSKEKRVWLRRKLHKPPKPPKLLTLTEAQKARIFLKETMAA